MTSAAAEEVIPTEPLLVLSTKHDRIWTIYQQGGGVAEQTGHACQCGQTFWSVRLPSSRPDAKDIAHACLNPLCDVCVISQNQEDFLRILAHLNT